MNQDALLRFQQHQGVSKTPIAGAQLELKDIPADVPMEDATITAWDGERFIDYEKWKVKRWKQNT